MAVENPSLVYRLRILGPGIEQERILSPGEYILGREEICDIQLADSYVSRRHAQLTVTTHECQLMDLYSSNGTNVNGLALQPNAAVIVPTPAVILIGPFTLTLEQVAEEQPLIDIPDEDPPEPVVLEPVVTAQPDPPAADPVTVDRSPIATEEAFPPGLTRDSLRLLAYLPAIYHTPFMSHFLALFESILIPIEWNVDNFDLYLSPGTAPASFLPWLAQWFDIAADPGWDEEQRRAILSEASRLYARRGTRWAMSRVLEILTGQPPEIIEFEDGQAPFTVTIKLNSNGRTVDQRLLERLVNANKPAHTRCILVSA